jgi:hypothetical protein
MKPYFGDPTEKHRIIAYDYDKDYIVVQFSNFHKRKYTSQTTGESIVSLMVSYARSQSGLTAFINQAEPDFETV